MTVTALEILRKLPSSFSLSLFHFVVLVAFFVLLQIKQCKAIRFAGIACDDTSYTARAAQQQPRLSDIDCVSLDTTS